MIVFEEVSAAYSRAAAPALERVSMTAEAGKLTAVVGPNGSGKTTLVRLLLGRLPLLTGKVLLEGQPLSSLSRRQVARKVAVVVQREETTFPMRVADYLALGRYPHSRSWFSPPPALESLRRAAATAGVEQLLERSTEALSGGEWQRVRLARALVQDTPAIVLDEPTTFLDIAHEMEIFELLSSLARAGHCVLAVSHQLNLVARFADRVVLLSRGRCAAQGAPAEVMQARTIEAVYGWPVVVTRDAASGAPSIVPLRRPAVGASHGPF
jgi:iron complex transport system ATP-binding protein